MEDKKKDVIDAEVKEVSSTTEPAKKEETKPEEKKAYDKDNLTRSIIYAAIITVLSTLHSILGGFVSGNLPWFIINLFFTAAGVVMVILTALFFFRVTKDNLKNDIPSFVVSLAALVVSLLCTIGWSVDLIANMIGTFKDLANSVSQ